MMYSEMSDFEINREVAGKVGGFLANDILEEEQTIFKWHPGNKYSKFDPCNSWADAGPIIEENGIAIFPFKKTTPAAFPSSEGLVSKRLVEHKNVLRAAMIVFLMMQEQTNA
ncbi:phage protein NinX family protein [Pantoea agglomerans]|uniref:phage protein NinX family protein n=1 Tax=Enterobacter agglomerans TaxID=549 RepID=UPI003DA17CF0